MTTSLERQAQFAGIPGPRSAFDQRVERFAIQHPSDDFGSIYISMAALYPAEVESAEMFRLALSSDRQARSFALNSPMLLSVDRENLKADKLTASHEAEHFAIERRGTGYVEAYTNEELMTKTDENGELLVFDTLQRRWVYPPDRKNG